MFHGKLERKLAVWPDAGERVLILTEPWQGFTFRDELHRDELVRRINEDEVDVLVAAPLSRIGMQGGGTLDEIGEFAALVADVQKRCQRSLTVLLVHHENRAGQVSGAWEGFPDTLVHVQAQGHGRTRVYWQKLRWSSSLHGTTTHLTWADCESFTVEEREEITEASIADGILEAIRESPDTSWSRIRPKVKGNDAEKAGVLDRLLRDGLIVNTATREGHFNLWLPEDPASSRANVSTGLARTGAASPDGESGAVRATVPDVSRHGGRHGTDQPGLFDEETAA
jgi:hypothetical protein